MTKYITKKVVYGFITVLVIITVVFLLMRLLPTDYFFTEEQLMKLTPDQKQAALETAGMTDPVLVQLGNYFANLFTGDMGISRKIEVGVPVARLIGSRIGVSLQLGIVAMVISLVLGLLLGMFQTLHKNKAGDHIGTGFTIFANAVPSLVAFSLIMVIGTRCFGLPTLYSSRSYPGISAILPVICLSLTSIAGYAIWSRRYMVDELNKDYIKLAKMKGLTDKEIMKRHVFRNAFVPLVQYLPASFLLTIGGSLLVERFFSVPGMGPLLTDAIQRYDLNVVQGLVVIYAVMGIGGVILGDILMAVVDPRIKLAGKGGTR